MAESGSWEDAENGENIAHNSKTCHHPGKEGQQAALSTPLGGLTIGVVHRSCQAYLLSLRAFSVNIQVAFAFYLHM